MPYFDRNPLEQLALQADAYEAEIDLRGLDSTAALQRIEALLQQPRSHDRFLVRFDPPARNGRETLFLPLGRRLLEARRAGLLRRCLPSPDGCGYFIAF
jgi:hypothetical protein